MKIPSFKVKDLAEAMCPGVATKEVGIRPGEKLHEVMITAEDAPYTREYDNHFVIYPQLTFRSSQVIDESGRHVPEDFVYSSATNTEWMSIDDIKKRLPEAV